MNKSTVILTTALCCLIVVAACKDDDKHQQADNNSDSSLYSGPMFNEHIRSTDARTAEEERKGFKLPEGFEINLYASEPDIGKPINFTFDAKGRMWVTQSFEYPFPAVGKGRDRITILEDVDNDGKADKFTHFEDTLNIPIGIMPTEEGAVAYSIPSVYKFIDANHDGKPESSSKIMGPFEIKDTHGMVNNFIWGFDGWIHACHGYANRSNVAAADGDSIHLISGNTIRFRPDGSRVEHETAGRINPFGLTYDEWGYLYSSDCHTSPIYQMIRGGDYTQWGKEEGMGFAPDMKPFDNEATALAGITYYADNLFPKEYQKNLYIGDAVSSRIYRNSFTWKGASPIGKREEDFVKSADPWFRPVNVKMGPDGAMYIADFYNSIIGHYEVPLDHPKRDRIRGRIWRITYKGKSNKMPDLTTANIEELLKQFNNVNLDVRIQATNQMADRIGKDAITPAEAVLNKKEATTNEYVHSLWTLQRLHVLTDDMIKTAMANADPIIRVHALRTAAEQKDTSAALYPVAVTALSDKDVHVQRTAVELLGRYVNMNTVETLIAFRKKIPEEDTHMIYTIKLMLRNLLRHEFLMQEIAGREWKNEDAAVLSTVLAGVQVPASGIFLYNYVKNQELPKKQLPKAFMHIVRFVPAAQIDQVIATGKEKSGNDQDMEFQVFKFLQEGLGRRGAKESESFKTWGKKIVTDLFAKTKSSIGTSNRSQEVIDQQFFAVEQAGNYKLAAVAPDVISVYSDTAMRDYVRNAALRALMKMNPEKYVSAAGNLLQSNTTTAEFKRSTVSVLSEFPGDAVNKILVQVKNAPPDLQQNIVLALAGSASGRALLFEKVKKGEIFARTLVEPKVEDRLLMNISPAQKTVFDQLTSNIEAIDKEKQSIISGRIADYNNMREKPSPEAGHAIFVKNCSPCHSIKGEGGAIGPQLDGVGKWGVTPLTEKILDPNRNVSENFRNYTIKMKDGKVLAGLYRRDDGEVIVYADATGHEFSVAKKDIQEKKASKYTLMPDQFRNTIPVNDFYALITFLLTQKN